MSDIYRLVYAGVCEILVEAEHNRITRVLAATPDFTLVGQNIEALAAPEWVDVKLLGEP